MEYRLLKTEEINVLQKQGCTAEKWENITIHPKLDIRKINNANFSGRIQIGMMDKSISLPGGMIKHVGIRNASLHNCIVGNNVLIENIHNYIANYVIGDDTIIYNVNLITVDRVSSFGNGVEVSVLNETGGREVPIYDKLSAHFAYIVTFYRHRPQLIKNLQKIVFDYAKSLESSTGTIGSNVKIVNTGTIKNVRIADYTTIDSAKLLENGSINSNKEAPVHIGYNVIANDFIISSGTRITDGVMITRCFIGQACRLGHTYSASDSLFFSNCQGENGEACAIFAGPYTVTHHKSTLLIAGMFSFMNAGSGSNQSNHMYKLGPIHQGIVERGGKTTSNSYILWPARIGSFSLIMGRHKNNSDTSKLPFSYLIEEENETTLVPGINLRSVGTIRDAQKFPKRDKRTDKELLDHINFNLLSPYTIQKMFQGLEVLEELKNTSGATSKIFTYQGCIIKSSSLEKGIHLYHLAIKKFLGNSLISRLMKSKFSNMQEIRNCLSPINEEGLGNWRDLSGLIVPKHKVEELIHQIENNLLTDSSQINSFLQEVHANYYEHEWTWAWDKITSYYGLDIQTITTNQLIEIIDQWKEAVVSLDKLIYSDAQKEFSLSSRIGFGLDGDRFIQKIDFDQVRGVFEENQFVRMVLKHIDDKTGLHKLISNKLNSCIN